MIGYAFCGSFCTHKRSLIELENLVKSGYDVLPIMSENVYTTDTYFGNIASKIIFDAVFGNILPGIPFPLITPS